MRTIAFTVFAFALAIGFGVIGGSGLADVYGANDAPQAEQLSDKVNQSANESAAGNQDAFGGEVNSGGDDNNVIGLVISGIGAIASGAAAVAVLPFALMNLGLPALVAVPVGGLIQVVAGWGVIQFAAGRVWR